MADDGPTSPADSPAYQHTDDDTTPVPVASTIPFSSRTHASPPSRRRMTPGFRRPPGDKAARPQIGARAAVTSGGNRGSHE